MRRFDSVVSCLVGALIGANLIQFGLLIHDYGWRGIPAFLAAYDLAWLVLAKGVAAVLVTLLILVGCFLPEEKQPTAITGVHDGA